MITLKQRKKRILVVNEFSQLSTGFSTYMRYLLPRLHATGKYEIAEHAVYIDPHHPEIENVPWTVFPNLPDQRDRKGQELYKQNRFNQFGAWKFEEICLKWQPDIVIDIRDPWMSSFIFKSPYRKYFKFIHMPTCDGEPQKPEWLDMYAGADRVMTYSHWAKQVLESSSGGKIQVFGVGSPCPDIEEFRPVNKTETRSRLGLKPDSFIVQTVMRNQPRKLYPELFRAFARFLELCKERNRDDIAVKSFLHCHTSHPDLGWDLPTELRRYGISHKVLFTYLCDHCKSCYVTFFNQEVANCRACGNLTAGLPNTVRGVDRPDLARIMGMADLYIQYSVAEGWAMPIGDAKACGVPIMAMTNSAMTEQAYAPGGIPIKVQRLHQESLAGTNQWRALPDIEDTAEKMFAFFTAPQEHRDALGRDARQLCETHYNWDLMAKVWENAIDTLETPDPKETWLSNPKLVRPNTQIPPNLTHEQFVEWCFRNILNEPLTANAEFAQKAIASLHVGYEPGQDAEGHPIKVPVNRDTVLNHMMHTINHKNQMEMIRYNMLVAAQHQKVEPGAVNYVEV